jgi:hypothetical protein
MRPSPHVPSQGDFCRRVDGSALKHMAAGNCPLAEDSKNVG